MESERILYVLASGLGLDARQAPPFGRPPSGIPVETLPPQAELA